MVQFEENPERRALLGLSFQSYAQAEPEPIYNWGGSSLFAGLSSPIVMSALFTHLGQTLQPTAGGQAVAGFVTTPRADQAAIVIGHSGRTILNGFDMEEVTVVNNAVRLAQNEIDYFYRPLAILAQPTNQSVRPGGSVTNTVRAFGPSGPITYQWRFNGTNLPGANNFSLVINNVQLANEGIYSVVVSDPLGSITSSNTTLTMLVLPSLVAPVPPLNFSAVAGESITLGVEVQGTLPMYCQWRVFRSSGDNQVLTNQTLTERLSFITFTIAANSAGAYVVHLTNSVGGSLNQSHTNAVLTLLADTDADGLPDVWETAYPTATDPALDSDNDGLTNLEEYRAGTNPTNAASVLRITRITAGNSATLEFEAISNKTYTVQHKDRVSVGSWLKLLDVVARASNRTEMATDPGARTNRYYRLVTPRQP